MGSRIHPLSLWAVALALGAVGHTLRANDAPVAEPAPAVQPAPPPAVPPAPAIPPPAAAPATPAPAPLPGHSAHGEAFDEGPRRSAYLMGTTGAARIPITTKSPVAQAFFDQGLGQLHGFWYLEAERSFRQAASIDPSCAMAYWGMAMANTNNEKRAKVFIAKAVERKEGLTRLETLWVDALDAYYKADAGDDKGRKQRLLDAMKKIVDEFPDDVEAKALFVVHTWQFTQNGIPITDYDALDAMLESVFKARPDHPAHHYRIHLWDDKDANRALTSAARCGQSAPGIAHMWHMPGHTYSKLNRFEDAAYQQEASARVDHAYMVRDRVMPYEIHNYAHNNEWLVRNLVSIGRVREALDLAKNLIELPRHPKYNTLSTRGSAQYGRARLIDVLSQHEMWDEYLAACGSVYLNEDDNPEQKIRRLRYLGVAHAALGKADEAMKQVTELESMRATLKVEGYAAAAKAAADAVARKDPPEKVTQVRDEARKQSNERVAAVEKAVAHVNAMQAAAAGDHASVPDLLAKAEAAKEHIAQAWLKAGDNAKAEQAAREAADAAKGQAYPLANLVEVLHRCGKAAEAKEAFERLRALSPRVDLAASPYARLAPIAAEFGYPADWRVARATPTDVGTRPDLDALGPFRWRPSPAPPWTATAADGKAVSLSDYQGKPVVVVFYLGAGCVHCTRQLHAFGPLAQQFAEAGISLVAISTDAPDAVRSSLATASADGTPAFPFPIVSDVGLQAFKAYHAYDDFEAAPLHGTFLVDGRGLIRWRDVSAEPFEDGAFLLREAKRLLAQPAPADATARAAG
jgi:peroxiredoxin